MKTALMGTSGCIVLIISLAVQADPVEPKVVDALQSVRLRQSELSGEIGRRIDDLIYKNYMALDLERDFLEPFRTRPYDGAKTRAYMGVGKVIDAGSMFAVYTGDSHVAERTKRIIDELIKTRDSDGYIGFMKREPDGKQNYRNWTLHEHEYLILGLTDHYRYCGDSTSLEHARKLADYVLETFPKNPHPEVVCTAGLPESMLLLYRCTGDPRYLRFAADTRHGNPSGEVACATLRDWEQGYSVRNTSHIYVNLARCYAQTMLYRLEPNERLLTMSRRILGEFLSTEEGKDELLIIGSGSRDEHFGRQQDGSGNVCESCVTAYWIRLLDSLERFEGDLRYGDLVERTIYNALFAAQEPAGRRLRYFTPFTGKRHYFNRDGFCCPGNYRRIVAELPQMVYYRTQERGVVVNLYTQSKKVIPLDKDHAVTISQQTDYPTSGVVRISVSPSQTMTFPLRLRIPRWCPKARLAINGVTPLDLSAGETYHEIRRTWNPGDMLALDMPMPWRWVRGRKLQKGRAALMRGPVVYCIGTQHNAEVLKMYSRPRDLMIDPATLGDPVADTAVRPGGLIVTAKAWPPGKHGDGAPSVDVVFSEFVDPSGIATYFLIPDCSVAVDDELIGNCFAN